MCRPLEGRQEGIDGGSLDNKDGHALVRAGLVPFAAAPERSVSRGNINAHAVRAGDPAGTLHNEEELVAGGMVKRDQSAGADVDDADVGVRCSGHNAGDDGVTGTILNLTTGLGVKAIEVQANEGG